MRSTSLAMAALAGIAAAQNLTSVLTGNNQTTQLAALLAQSPDLVTALSNATNTTVFAPSNDAIAMALNTSAGAMLTSDPTYVQALLSYHIIQGNFSAAQILNSTTPLFLKTMSLPSNFANVTGGQNVEVVGNAPNVTIISGLEATSNVVQADIAFDGGVVHVIDSLLTLPANISTTASAANLTGLAGALTAAQLVAPVESMQDITVFAPNNAAFQAIGSALPNLSTSQLTDILTYHVVNGSVVFSTDLMNGTQVPTLNGANLSITIDGENYFVNGAQIIMPNVLVANGVVHVIDNVLNPANATATPMASATVGAPAFSGASSASDIAITSGVPAATTTLGGGAGVVSSASASASASASGAGASGTSSSTAGAPMMTAAFPIAGLLAAGAAFII